MKEKIRQLSKIFKTFPKKHHIEYVSALLSIPVILSVLILNFSNLENRNKTAATSISPTSVIQNEKQNPIIIQTSPSQTASVAASEDSCKKEVGPINIDFPKENQTVSDNPVCIIIKKNDNYCSSVWSYKINSGNWSQYDSNSPCLYNLPEGNIKFSLKVQSTVSSDTTLLERNFIYKSDSITPTATSSASQ